MELLRLRPDRFWAIITAKAANAQIGLKWTGFQHWCRIFAIRSTVVVGLSRPAIQQTFKISADAHLALDDGRSSRLVQSHPLGLHGLLEADVSNLPQLRLDSTGCSLVMHTARLRSGRAHTDTSLETAVLAAELGHGDQDWSG